MPESQATASQGRIDRRGGGAHRRRVACTGRAHLGAHLEEGLKGRGAHLKHLKEKRFRGLEGLTRGQGVEKGAERVTLFSGVSGVHGSVGGGRAGCGKKDRRVSAGRLVVTQRQVCTQVCTGMSLDD